MSCMYCTVDFCLAKRSVSTPDLCESRPGVNWPCKASEELRMKLNIGINKCKGKIQRYLTYEVESLARWYLWLDTALRSCGEALVPMHSAPIAVARKASPRELVEV
jgi:hypothetical protein